MSVIAYAADSVLTSAVNGRLIDATSYLDSEASSVLINNGTTYDSATFIPGAITTDALFLKLVSNVGPAGTLTVKLRNFTDSTDVVTVTCNLADFGSGGSGWAALKYASQALLAGKAYLVRITCDVAASGRIRFYTNATANNFSRLLRTTTAQAPAAGDMCVVCGEITGAGTSTTRTVTMDSDGTTTYGSLVYGFNGIVNWDTTAGVTRELKLSGFTRSDAVVDGIQAFTGGLCNIGSSGTPYPSTSTAAITYSVGSNVAFGREMRGGTMNRYGSPKTLQAFLSQDYSAGATSIVITPVGGGTQTGIKAGDLIAIAPGSTNAAGVTACESFVLGVDPVGNTITLPSGLVNDRLNVAIYPVEVMVLSTNVKERGASNVLQSYIFSSANALGETSRYAEISRMGSSTSNKRGIDWNGGSCDIQNCVLREFGSTLANVASIGSCQLFSVNNSSQAACTFSSNVIYAVSTAIITIQATTVVHTISGNWAGGGVNTNGFSFVDAGSTYTNNRIFGISAVGISVTETNAVLGICTGNVAHHCASVGIRFANIAGGAASGLLSYKNSTADLSLQGIRDLLTIDSSTFAWSPGSNIVFDASCYAQVTFTSCNLKRGLSGTLTPTTVGVNGNQSGYAAFRNCSVEAGQIVNGAGGGSFFQGLFDNCLFPNSTSDVALPSAMLTGSYVAFSRYNGVVGSEKFYRPEGARASDTVIFDAGARSTRLTPNSVSVKLPTHTIFVPVASGQTPTVSVRVRKSASTDAGGANYNGNQPRLMLRARYAMGVTTDTVLATYAAGTGSWNTLSATLPAAPRDGVYELYVDCDGTAGWINVDTETVVGAATDAAGTAKYWTADAAPLPFNPGTLVSLTLSGLCAGVATVTGSPKVDRKVTGTCAGQAGVTGAPKVERRAAGTFLGQAGVTGAPKVERRAAGTFLGQAGVTGAPKVDRKLSGPYTFSGISTVTGSARSAPFPIVTSTGFTLRYQDRTSFALITPEEDD